MRLVRGWIAAPLLAAVLLVAVAGPAPSAGASDALVVSADDSGGLGIVVIAQTDVDPEPDTERRLVDRETSERVDGVVIALWSIAVGMTVMLVLFLWHTSPRRRLRLARRRSTELYEAEGAGSGGTAPEDSAGDRTAEDSATSTAAANSPPTGSKLLRVNWPRARRSEAVGGDVAEDAEVEAAEGGLAEAVEDDSAGETAGGDTRSRAGTNRGSVGSRLWAWLKDLT